MLLPGCLKEIHRRVAELIVVDTGSRDATPEIAKRFGARVIFHRWKNDFAEARNVYLQAAHLPWILVLDAPERIARRDVPRLARLIRGDPAVCYNFPVRNYTDTFNRLWGWHSNRGEYPNEERASTACGWFSSGAIRLFPRSEKIFYEGFRHAAVGPSAQRAGIPIRQSGIPLHDVECLRGERWIRAKLRRRLQWMLQALSSSPDRRETLFDVGRGLFSLGVDDERAAKYLQQAIRLDPRPVEPRQLLGMVLLTLGRSDKASEVLQYALRMAPHNADILCLLGIAQLCQEDLSTAAVTLRRSLALHPDHPIAWNGLGVAHEAQGKRTQAIASYRRAVHLHPRYREARRNLASILARENS